LNAQKALLSGINFTNVRCIIYMNSLLYVISVALFSLWVLGAFVYKPGYMIHALLVTAIITILIRIIKDARNVNQARHEQ
jgi:uncharacterized membrane protein YqjE